MIRRAMLSGEEQIDFMLADRSRVRAQLDEDCPALDFYGGFYLQFGKDQQICAKRDAIHSRMGGSCEIRRFRLLDPGSSIDKADSRASPSRLARAGRATTARPTFFPDFE